MVVFISYACVGTILFGHQLEAMATIDQACLTLVLMLLSFDSTQFYAGVRICYQLHCRLLKHLIWDDTLCFEVWGIVHCNEKINVCLIKLTKCMILRCLPCPSSDGALLCILGYACLLMVLHHSSLFYLGKPPDSSSAAYCPCCFYNGNLEKLGLMLAFVAAQHILGHSGWCICEG